MYAHSLGRHCPAGSVRRSFTCMVYSPDGAWLYAGTTTGDVVGGVE